MHTGNLGGKRVTVGNGGRFAPDTAMTTEILCAAGAESLIRIGTCGSLQDHVKIVEALRQAADSLQVRYHSGWIYTTDALFQETPELIQELNEQNISSID